MSDQTQPPAVQDKPWSCKKHGLVAPENIRRYKAYVYKAADGTSRDVFANRCTLCQNDKDAARYLADPAARKAYTKQHRVDNPEKWVGYRAAYNSSHKEQIHEQQKQSRQDLRLRVLSHYSGGVPKCACCGESRIEFLCIDHVNGDGAKHRREIKRKSDGVWLWLEKNEFPGGFRVLCHNCNQSFGSFGGCPHDPSWKRAGPKNPGDKCSRNLKAGVFKYYGGKCACCGESRIELLSIDHVGGGGRAHRRSLGSESSTNFYRWIVGQGFPDTFRVLCHNCNFASGAYGKCPHSGSSVEDG